MQLKKPQNEFTRPNLLVEIISAILLVFFVHTLITSYVQIQSFQNLLRFYTYHPVGVSWSVIGIELAISIALFIRKTRTIGFILAILITGFAGFVIISHRYYPYDFGGILNYISKPLRWGILITVTILSVAGFLLSFVRFGQHKISKIDEGVEYT